MRRYFQERWEMRFDNMQPSVFWDDEENKWRAWYSTMSMCGGNVTGPGRDPSLPPDCQALPSNCSADSNASGIQRTKAGGSIAFTRTSE